jgi:hypothetical protein
MRNIVFSVFFNTEHWTKQLMRSVPLCHITIRKMTHYFEEIDIKLNLSSCKGGGR